MATSDCFLKIDGVTGESEDEEFKSCIDVTGWTWGVAAQPGTAQLKAGHADVRALCFTHQVDRASAAILTACVGNKALRSAELTMRRAGGKAQKYLRIELKDVKVVSVDQVHDAQALIPSEQVTLSFRSIDFNYTGQQASGGDRSGPSTFQWRMHGA